MGKLDKEHLPFEIKREEALIKQLLKKGKKALANLYKAELDKKRERYNEILGDEEV